MTVSIIAAGDSCTLKEVTPSTSVAFSLPLTKTAFVALLTELLADAELMSVESGPVRIDVMRDGPRVQYGSGQFALRYHDAVPLILEA